VPPGVLALIIVLGLLALVPTRRLARLGWSPGALAAYLAVTWLLGLIAATAGGPARLLVPVLLIAWLLPFLDWRGGPGRSDPAGRPERPIRNVTPPEDRQA
jgi:hypothetical protein